MTDQNLELQITRLLDGELAPEERAQLQAHLASNPDAQRLFQAHERLNLILQQPPALDSINWDRLATSISSNIDNAAADDQPELDDQPEVLFSFRWIQPAFRLAIAACALLAVGLGIWRLSSLHNQTPTGPANVQVAVLLPDERPTGQPAQQIDIGPSPAFAAANGNGDLTVQEAIVSPPTRVAIDSALLPAQDIDRLPY